MLSRALRRVLFESTRPPPPTFLLPWSAGLTTVSHTPASGQDLPPGLATANVARGQPPQPAEDARSSSKNSPTAAHQTPIQPALPTPEPGSTATSRPPLSDSVRGLLPLLQSQKPHYIRVHIHGKAYLVMQGDQVRLPFLMHGVEPGDVLRLNRATHVGSREFTLKAAAAAPRPRHHVGGSTAVVEPTTTTAGALEGETPGTMAPHFIPHIAQGKHAYLDERLFVCRAVVTGAESEPLRVKEKTKQRQRRVKRVKTKLRFTTLTIKELRVAGLEEAASA